MDKTLKEFFTSGEWDIYEGPKGWNNITRYIKANGERYVQRIYQTHMDIEKVQYEHEILQALQEYQLPFQTPEPLKTLKGETVTKTEDGKLVAVFRYLEGSNPNFHNQNGLFSFGQTVGKLSQILSKLKIETKPAYKPYYDFENTHPKCSLSFVIDFCSNPPAEFSDFSRELKTMASELINMQASIPEISKMPHQLVHGDLNASNILVDREEKVSAVLDFEFITYDLRVMEIAVCLSGLIKSGNDEEFQWMMLKEFISGFGSVGKLLPIELKVIPLLIKLRLLDVFIHFLGRYLDGIDKKEVVAEQLTNAITQVEWLNKNEGRLLFLCEKYIFI